MQVFGTYSRFGYLDSTFVKLKALLSVLLASFGYLTWRRTGMILRLRKAGVFFIVKHRKVRSCLRYVWEPLAVCRSIRPRLLRWRLLPRFRFFAAAASLPRTTTR